MDFAEERQIAQAEAKLLKRAAKIINRIGTSWCGCDRALSQQEANEWLGSYRVVEKVKRKAHGH